MNQVGQELLSDRGQALFERDVSLSADWSVLAVLGTGWSGDSDIKSGSIRLYDLVNGT